MTKIYLGADHRGFSLKEKIKEYLRNQKLEVEDMGATNLDPSDDYPDFAIGVAEKVSSDPSSIGVIFCGSSLGITVAANKVKGIIATNPRNVSEALEDKIHHGGNVLCISADHTDPNEAIEIFNAWHNTQFGGERHARRIEKIKTYESKN